MTIREELVSLLPRLRRFSLAVAGNAQDAEDLLHSALERALRHEAFLLSGFGVCMRNARSDKRAPAANMA